MSAHSASWRRKPWSSWNGSGNQGSGHLSRKSTTHAKDRGCAFCLSRQATKSALGAAIDRAQPFAFELPPGEIKRAQQNESTLPAELDAQRRGLWIVDSGSD